VRTRLSGLTLTALLVQLGGGCDAASADPGRDALLQVRPAQFVEGPLPDDSGGPLVTAVETLTTSLRPGETDRPLQGTLAAEATAVAIGLEGDRGYWTVVASAPDVILPDQPTFAAELSTSIFLMPGPAMLLLAAVDDNGRVGPPKRIPMTVSERPVPAGALVVSLTWDDDADLDLHVVDPKGVEIWSRNRSSAISDRPGAPPSDEVVFASGYLDVDSNSGCLVDGRRQENVIWPNVVPRGRVSVRVNTASLCATPTTRWQVEVRREGTRIASASGTSSTFDTRFAQGLGAGLLVLELDL